MFILAEGQIRPKHDFSLTIKKGNHHFDVIRHSINSFKQQIQNNGKNITFEKISEIAKNQFASKSRYQANIDYKITQNSVNSKWANDSIVLVNIVKHKRKKVLNENKKFVSNEKEGVIAYFYIISSSIIDTYKQQDSHFTLKFKKTAIIAPTATFKKQENVIFEVIKGKEVFFVRTSKEAEYLKDKGYEVKPIKYIESNGVIFEVVRAITQPEIRVVDFYENKIKVYKTNKNAVQDGRSVFAITMNGISGKNYFTKDFENASEGFYKVYGEVEGYVLVETVVSILNGSQKIITFIKKNDKETIDKIASKLKVIEE